MSGKRGRRPVRLALERLEARETPSATPWLSETFDTTPVGSLPANWSQWSSDPSASFAVSSAQALSAANGLVVTAGMSRDVAHAWYSPVAPANVQVTAAVFVDSLIPAQVLARGSALNTAAPTFYAVEITRGLELDLVRVINGVSTPLAQLKSAAWFSDDWAEVTLSVNGTSLQAQVYRPDTNQYLNAAGQWQTGQAWALAVTDAAISGAGQVGLGRPASYTGAVDFDDFTAESLAAAPAATLTQSFDTTQVGTLPAGWSQWSSAGSAAFAVSPALALSPPNGLAVTALTSHVVAQAWDNTLQPADLQVTAAVYLNSLIPAQVLARGSGLGSATPTFYDVAVSRGLEVELQRTLGGVTTTLATLTSATWFSDQWVRVTLAIGGTTLQAQVMRADTGQYLNAAGQWQATPAWALTVTDAAISGSGFAGLGRPASYVGTVNFDDFNITPLTSAPVNSTESFDTTPVGTLPAGWSQWSSAGSAAFAVSSALALSPPNGLAVTALTSRVVAEAWNNTLQPANLQVTAAVYLNSLIPAQVLARGSGLGSATPTFYALAVSRGLVVDLQRTLDGVTTTLATLTSATWLSDQWVRVTLALSGSTLQAQVFRTDTAQYLNIAGLWQGTPAWALSITDTSISGGGLVGLGRPASYVGTVTFDDFAVTPAAGVQEPPVVTFQAPTAGAVLTGVATVAVSASAVVPIAKVEFYVDGVSRATVTSAPFQWDFDTSTASNGSHTLTALAFDLDGNVGQASVTVVTQNTLTNTLWSGHVIVPGSSVNVVGGTWVQPAISSTGANSTTYMWVGIDGYNGSTVEQIGTVWSAAQGYQAWLEFYGDGVTNAQGQWIAQGKYFYQTSLNSIIGSNFFTIQPGDTISATVAFVSSTASTSTFEFQFEDTPRGGQTKSWKQVLTTQYVVPARTSGEWIVETPNFGAAPLANFGTVTFSGAWATAGTTTGPITAFANYALNLVPGSNAGGGTDSTSTIVNANTPGPWESVGPSSSFTITFVSANSSTANSTTTPTSAPAVGTIHAATEGSLLAAASALQSPKRVMVGWHRHRQYFNEPDPGEQAPW